MAAPSKHLVPSTLKPFENAAAGHAGVLMDDSGELLIKPCTQAEIDFYQQTQLEHPEFAELMPTFMGTISLGAPAQAVDAIGDEDILQLAQTQKLSGGKKIDTDIAIVLENLEHGFARANVLDLKLGLCLYDPESTAAEKRERLDKVAAETTTGSLGFRVAGMKVWNGSSFDVYDKSYGRTFNAENVSDGFATFFAGLGTGLKPEDAAELLETIQADIVSACEMLQRLESRMYSASLLIIYEGDSAALDVLVSGARKTPLAKEKAPTLGEVEQSKEDEDADEDEDEDEDEPPVAYRVNMIDFAHATWTAGQGKDDNMIVGLKNVAKQMGRLIAFHAKG